MKTNDENKTLSLVYKHDIQTLLSLSLAYKLSDVFDSCNTPEQYECALTMYNLAKKCIKDSIENKQDMENEMGYFISAMCMYFNQREKAGYFQK